MMVPVVVVHDLAVVVVDVSSGGRRPLLLNLL
jgi:hypothetical protein